MNPLTRAYAVQTTPADILAKLRADQDQTIRDGLDSGSLTAEEGKALQSGQDAITAKVKKAKADGTLSVTELRDLQQAIRQAGQNIYTLSHNKALVKKGPAEVLASMRESQAKQIQAGVDSGAITPEEAKTLQKTQDALAKMEEKAKADGTVSLGEMLGIQQARKAAARDIASMAQNKSVTTKTPSDALASLRTAQEAEIKTGIASGSLTPQEAKLLNASQASIAKMEDKAKADGTVSAKELQAIKNARDVQEQQIYRLASNKAVVSPSASAGTSGSGLSIQV